MRELYRRNKQRFSIILALMLVFQLVLPMLPIYTLAVEDEAEGLGEVAVEEENNSEDETEPQEAIDDEPEVIVEDEDSKEEKAETGLADQRDEKEQEKEGEKTKVEEQDVSKDELRQVVSQRLNEDGNDLGNIFTFDYLTLNDKAIEDGDIISIKPGTIAHLGFKWNTEGLNAKAGDWAEINLADAFAIVTTPTQDIIVEGVNVGTFSVTNGVLRFEFNENIEQDDVQNGFVDLGLEFNLEKFRENIEQEIKFNDKSEKTLTVIARPNGKVSGIDKEGHPDREHDAREITWTIDVINTNDEAITAATVKDIIPKGLALQEGSFVINELSVGYEGNKVVGREDTTATPSINGNEFEFTFDYVAPFKGYRIQYTTTIEDYSKDTFTNDATFSYEDKELQAKATVGGLTRSDVIEKDGWQIGDTDEIEWRISVNKSGSEIENAVVHDNLPEGLNIIDGSIEVYKVVDGQPKPVDGFNPTDFPIELGQLKSNDEYEIRFKTSIDYSAINDGNYQKNNGFLNTAEIYDDEKPLDEDDATVEVIRDPILRKVGKSNIDYDNKTLTWTIHVNEARHPIGNVVLTDLIPKGLSITGSDIEILDEDGEVYTPDGISIDPDAEGGTAVVINLGDVGTRKLTITYTTTITDFAINSFKNGVGITGDGIGKEGNTGNAEIKPAANSFNKSYRGIDYNAKTIDWQIKVNPIREAISELEIIDTFPNKGLILLPETVTVSYRREAFEKGKDYTLEPRTEEDETGYHKGFIITLNSNALPLDKGELVIDYKTSYDPQCEVEGNTLDPHDGEEQARVYKNHVQFIGKTVNNNDFNVKTDAQTTVRKDSWNSGKKEGQLVHFDDEGNVVNGWVSGATRKIAWQLYFNYQQQNLGTGVEITDTLAYKGTIDSDSIKVSVYHVAANGNTSITDNVLDPSNYTVDVDGDEFTLAFADGFEVTKRYVIEFTTSVPDVSQPNYTNNANVKVGDVDYPYSATLNYDRHNDFLGKGTVGVDGNKVFTGDEVNWEVKVNGSLSIIKDAIITDTISAGLVYVNDILAIFKLEGTKEVALVEGEDYTLDVVITEDNKTVLTIKLIGDLENTLILRYTTVVTETSGQVNNTISLDGSAIEMKTVESNKLEAREFSNVGGEWSPARGALRVTKVDSEEDEVIAHNEATFTLWYDLNGERVQFGEQEYTTENGVLTIGNLPLRTYYLREVSAPNGYVLSKEELEIVVDTAYRNKEENIELGNFENTKEKIDITGTKVWEGGEFNRPESIQLQLYRDGDILGESVTLNGTEDTPWTYIWADLDKTDINGKEYTYSVKEVDEQGKDFTPENYKKAEDGLTVTNTYVIPKTEVKGTKVWVNGEKDRPESIKLQLYRDGEVYGEPVVLESDKTEYTWTNLDKTDEDGKEYKYTIDEIEVPENYEKEVSKDGLTITNIYVPPKTEITGTKVWIDGPEEKPAIQLQLYRNGEAYLEPITLENGETSYTWENLDLTDKNAVDYVYTVDEVEVPENYGMTRSDDKLTITNTYASPKTDITGRKVWEGGLVEKPTIELQLYRDGEAFGEPMPLENGEYEYTWKDLDKTDPQGVEYIYTVDEVEVPGNYEKAVEGLTVTNTYVSPKTEITGTKVWVDAPDSKPDIQLQLYRNGAALGEPVTLESGKTEYTWTDMHLTDLDGNPYTYTVDEVEVPEHYEKMVSENGLTITNTYMPEEMGDIKDSEKPSNGGLPKTGEIPTLFFYLGGALLILLGIVMALRKKRA